jgi:hypothetical protein
MKVAQRNIVLSAALLIPLIAALVFAPVAPATAATSPLDFRNTMRQLWEEHIEWTRLAIVAILDDAPEKDAAVQRLLQNQADLGNAIKPYYGDAAGEQLTTLLKEHITGAAALLTAAKGGDTAAINTASAQWYANGDAIATFLHNANPNNWPLDALKGMMKTHLDTTLTEATAHLRKDYPADIAAYDAVQAHILMMADALSSGIIAQFPDRDAPAPPAGQTALQLAMRQLWEDHITWTRLTILGVFSGDAETNATVQRLLQNQDDIGNAIKPYYGDAAGNQLTTLLKEHITGAAALLTAAKAGDAAAINTASAQWYANGDAIATFLHNANPDHWPLDALKGMMKTHLDTTLTEALANLHQDYPADAAAYDAVQMHILMMADALSSGIIAQFPDRFGAAPVPGMPRTGAPADSWVPGGLLFLAGAGLVLGGWKLRRSRVSVAVPVEDRRADPR